MQAIRSDTVRGNAARTVLAVISCLVVLIGCTDTSTSTKPASSAPPGSTGSGTASVSDVLGFFATLDFVPPSGFDKKHFGVSYGTTKEREYYSTTTGTNRKCMVYTPPNYDPNATYPVLYLLHGIGGTHTEWLDGAPNQIISNLIHAGQLKPLIVVMPNVRARADDGPPADALDPANIAAFDNFVNDLRDDLMPFIEQNYSVVRQREGRAIAGLSMGGKEALYIGVTMPETFEYIGAFSPAWGLVPERLSPDEMTLPEKFKDQTLIFINCGKQDDLLTYAERYNQAFVQNGIQTAYYTIDGGHDFSVWKNGLYLFLRCIFW